MKVDGGSSMIKIDDGEVGSDKKDRDETTACEK